MRLLFTLLLTIGLTPINAQIVNGNFENWISFEGALLLQGWEIYAEDDEASVTQDLDAYEGMYAVRVEAIQIPLGAYGNASTVFSIDEVPPSLDFYVKAASEFGGVRVEIIFYNGEETVETFYWSSAEEEINNWTYESIPLDQDLTDVTSARINITAEVGDFAPGSAVISVDQMAFGTISGFEDNSDQLFKLYPNPASDFIQISEASEVEQLEIRDLTGKLVGRYSRAAVQHQISLLHLAPACYTAVAHLKSGATARQQLVISR